MDRIHDIQNLLQTGIDLMVASGYHHTSINEVIRQAKLPKGSFYYLYKDKKEFALAAIKNYSDELVASMEHVFADTALSPIEAVKQYYRQSIEALGASRFSQGCLLGNMGQEMSDVDEDFRKLIDQAFQRVHDTLQAQLVKAKQAGELSDRADADVLADLIINMWHGSLIRMKASRSEVPLNRFIEDFFEIVCNI